MLSRLCYNNDMSIDVVLQSSQKATADLVIERMAEAGVKNAAVVFFEPIVDKGEPGEVEVFILKDVPNQPAAIRRKLRNWYVSRGIVYPGHAYRKALAFRDSASSALVASEGE